MSALATLEHQRQNVWHQMKTLHDVTEREKRDFTAAEQAQWNTMSSEIDTLAARIRDLQDVERREQQITDTFARITGNPAARALSASDVELDNSFRQAVLQRNYTPINVSVTERRSGYQPGVEARAITTASGSGMTGTTFWNQLVKHLVEGSAVLAAGATLLVTETGEQLRVPKTTALSTAAIVTEGAAISASDPTLGTAALTSYKYGFTTQVSSELAQDAAFDLLGYLAEEAGIAIANGAGTHFVTGTGSSQPAGVVTGATLGVTGGTGVTGAFTADNLIDLYYSVAAPYARSASAGWLMRNSTLAAVRKLKDSQNRYLFQQDVPVGGGAAGTLLGRPVYVDPNVAAVALSAKAVLFGDFSRYYVRQAGSIRFERSDDFAFTSDLITFRGLARLDGVLVDQTGAVKYFQGAAT